MNIKLLKKFGLYAGILLLFIGLAYGFTPEVLDGKIVNQGDISQWKGMANEAVTHNAENPDDPTAWSDAMFGGMPTTATIDSFEGDYTDNIYDFLLTGRRPASYLLISLIGGFLLMLTLGTSTLIAVGGAIAMTFCSYNFQIITAGHNTKMQAIAYFPWVLAAIIFTYKSALKNSRFLDSQSSLEMTEGRAKSNKTWWLKVILGAILFAFALSFQIKANHIQITYYLGIVVFAFILGLLIYLCIDKARRSKMLKNFFIASGILLVAGGVGIATNANKLIPTYEYSKYTMRGGSELTSNNKTTNQNGLSLKYATEGWSYGFEELPNLLIPNYNGGASATPIEESAKSDYVNMLRNTYTEMYMKMFIEQHGAPTNEYQKREYEKAAKYYADLEEINDDDIMLPTYWGPQQYTAGPMYMGAITIFLFILGLILCKGREKWWLLVALIISILLALGEHFISFTKLWFDYAPMYNKFRTVSMALIVLQIAMPMLGFVVLDRIMKVHYEKRRLFIAGGIAFAFTAGFCLLCMLNPNTAGTHVTNLGANDISQWLANYRKDLLVSDATRSFVLISIAVVLIALPYVSKTFQTTTWRRALIGGVLLVVLFDLWGAGKRYLNEKHFVKQDEFNAIYSLGEDPYKLNDPNDDVNHFRVLDIPRFGTAITSYYYNTIGGYSAVKMQRYEDLLKIYIDKDKSQDDEIGHFSKIEKELINKLNAGEISQEEFYENMAYVSGYTLPICSMLNGKYIIGDSGQLYENPYAFGNCWFANDYTPAQTPDEEIKLIGEIDLYNTAVIGNDFAWARKHFEENPYDGEQFDNDRFDYIELTHYAPNYLRYEFSTNRERAALFSEIYYPKGWKAWIEPAGKYGQVVDGRYQPTSEGYQIDIFRANWILRGAIIPKGEGTLVMRFEPESYRTGETVSRISSILLILLLLGTVGTMIYMKRK